MPADTLDEVFFFCVSDDVCVIVSFDNEQLINTSGGIAVHLRQCAAIAEIESEEIVENSLFAPPEGQSHVKSKTVYIFPGSGLGAKATTTAAGIMGATGSPTRRQKKRKVMRWAPEVLNTDDSDVGTFAASATLLSLNANDYRRDFADGKV